MAVDTREFVARLKKNEKGELEVQKPKEIEESENPREGDFVKVRLKRVKKARERKNWSFEEGAWFLRG